MFNNPAEYKVFEVNWYCVMVVVVIRVQTHISEVDRVAGNR